MTTARTGLGIIWGFTTAGERELAGVGLLGEVPGFRIVGYWPDADGPGSVDAERFADIWPEHSIETHANSLHDVDDESVVRHQRIAVWIKRWPESGEWRACLEASLRFFVQQGAALAWCEREAGIVMYDPFTAFEGCYAAYTSTKGLIWLGDLDDRLRTLNEEPSLVEQLHAAVESARQGKRPGS